MVYSKENKGFDLGNMWASDYKFNKFVFLPKPKSVRKEALKEVRRREMISTYAKAADRINEVEKEKVKKMKKRKKRKKTEDMNNKNNSSGRRKH